MEINHRKSSNLASSPTKKRRYRLTRKHREMYGGSSVDDSKAQMISDFKRNSHEIKKYILDTNIQTYKNNASYDRIHGP